MVGEDAMMLAPGQSLSVSLLGGAPRASSLDSSAGSPAARNERQRSFAAASSASSSTQQQPQQPRRARPPPRVPRDTAWLNICRCLGTLAEVSRIRKRRYSHARQESIDRDVAAGILLPMPITVTDRTAEGKAAGGGVIGASPAARAPTFREMDGAASGGGTGAGGAGDSTSPVTLSNDTALAYRKSPITWLLRDILVFGNGCLTLIAALPPLSHHGPLAHHNIAAAANYKVALKFLGVMQTARVVELRPAVHQLPNEVAGFDCGCERGCRNKTNLAVGSGGLRRARGWLSPKLLALRTGFFRRTTSGDGAGGHISEVGAGGRGEGDEEEKSKGGSPQSLPTPPTPPTPRYPPARSGRSRKESLVLVRSSRRDAALRVMASMEASVNSSGSCSLADAEALRVNPAGEPRLVLLAAEPDLNGRVVFPLKKGTTTVGSRPTMAYRANRPRSEYGEPVSTGVGGGGWGGEVPMLSIPTAREAHIRIRRGDVRPVHCSIRYVKLNIYIIFSVAKYLH
jgi:hypothetical protein